MNIDIICVGKLKEAYWKDAVSEYSKRLTKYCKLRIIEVIDEKTPDKQGLSLDEKVKLLEGERILRSIKTGSVVITLEISGRMMDSVDLSQEIERISLSGCSDIQFVIGGSLGLHTSVSKRADIKLSFSKMTFPHQLMRVLLLEQIYRSFRIINHEPYHK